MMLILLVVTLNFLCAIHHICFNLELEYHNYIDNLFVLLNLDLEITDIGNLFELLNIDLKK